MDKAIWIISGGIEAIPGIKRAKEMGLFVIVSDGSPSAPGFAFADDSIVVSTYDVEKTVKAVSEYNKNKRKIDGVICIASDVPLTVANVAHEFGLPGISIKTAELSINKLKMKELFVEKNIPIPWFSKVENASHLKELAKKNIYPLVLKPVDSRGARGVLQVTNKIDLDWAYKYALGYSPSKSVMVEEFLSGNQISTEALIVNNKGYNVGFTDRNYEYIEKYFPFIIENGGGFPSVIDKENEKKISQVAIDAGLAMGISTGVAKGDMVLTKEGPKVIEIAARLSGGWLSTDQIPLGLGVDFVGAAIKIALGEKVNEEDLIPKISKGDAVRYFFPEPGEITSITNVEKYVNLDWVYKLGIFAKVGDYIGNVTDHTKRVGFVITTGKDKSEAVFRAKEVVKNIIIKTEK